MIQNDDGVFITLKEHALDQQKRQEKHGTRKRDRYVRIGWFQVFMGIVLIYLMAKVLMWTCWALWVAFCWCMDVVLFPIDSMAAAMQVSRTLFLIGVGVFAFMVQHVLHIRSAFWVVLFVVYGLLWIVAVLQWLF